MMFHPTDFTFSGFREQVDGYCFCLHISPMKNQGFSPSVVPLVVNSGSHGFTSAQTSMELSREVVICQNMRNHEFFIPAYDVHSRLGILSSSEFHLSSCICFSV